jgi:hypothetical protein
MRVDAADYGQDGWLDLFVTNVDHESFSLYHNSKDDSRLKTIPKEIGGKDGHTPHCAPIVPGGQPGHHAFPHRSL